MRKNLSYVTRYKRFKTANNLNVAHTIFNVHIKRHGVRTIFSMLVNNAIYCYYLIQFAVFSEQYTKYNTVYNNYTMHCI